MKKAIALLSLAIVNLCYGLAVAVGLWVIGKTLGGGGKFATHGGASKS